MMLLLMMMSMIGAEYAPPRERDGRCGLMGLAKRQASVRHNRPI
ncbi:hypothetical protein [Bradyrhizobium retamae]|nr:hypothetical protein [Bradyrhizobium retamae]